MTQPATAYLAASDRYQHFAYRPAGRSGLKLPPLSLGLWHNFGNDVPLERQRDILRTSFDLGITHFDLANNYGTPYGSAESNFGRLLKEDFQAHRDELIISTKAGWDMWPGPYGQGGSSRKYLLASLEQSLQRLGLDYVDIFYSHRFDPETPMEETAWALASAVQQGKALYVGISSYSPAQTVEFAALLRQWHIPLLIHQPSYSIFNRKIEAGLFDAAVKAGAGMIAFSPLAQGLLTNRYLQGIPADSRAGRGTRFLRPESVSAEVVAKATALNEIAKARGQTLAQLAIAWVLRDPRMTSTIIGASSGAQVRENLGALKQLSFTSEELAAIDRIAPGPG
ncbi:L-glyceraldehyde 3-phosphate reductase [Steroidobacter sp.]|uniref:L-glyceraldehyde 3-phosphate reductase n=1 Tax=Steroidobacter sp. TaxID=1978227 RepID=UPI001A4C2CDC|nr:L-glyceraldehyde 3-phosphate reductase [Steroidobacter sp.]MBL8271409.1 L-glyceraldehyde 3-phosphate reductase [Steroidobacter sp.]